MLRNYKMSWTWAPNYGKERRIYRWKGTLEKRISRGGPRFLEPGFLLSDV